jgi:3-hydroxybutyryl-CoA dehydrogenase
MRITLTGDTVLLAEYSALCVRKGHAVTVRFNPEERPDRRSGILAKGVKTVLKPARSTDIALELTNTSPETKRKNVTELDRILPPGVPLLTSSTVVPVAEQLAWVRHPGRVIGIGALPTLLGGDLIEFASSPATAPATVQAARRFAESLGKESAVIRDAVGLVLPRILCALANEAYFALGEDVAPRTALDSAMKLGVHYPHGPLEWAERIGVRQVHAVMAALYQTYGEERYRVAPLLREAAALDVIPR